MTSREESRSSQDPYHVFFQFLSAFRQIDSSRIELPDDSVIK